MRHLFIRVPGAKAKEMKTTRNGGGHAPDDRPCWSSTMRSCVARKDDSILQPVIRYGGESPTSCVRLPRRSQDGASFTPHLGCRMKEIVLVLCRISSYIRPRGRAAGESVHRICFCSYNCSYFCGVPLNFGLVRLRWPGLNTMLPKRYGVDGSSNTILAGREREKGGGMNVCTCL